MTTLTRLLHQPCTVRYLTPGPPDEHNDPTDVYAEIDTKCVLQQRARSEFGDGQVPSGVWWVWLGPDVPIPGPADQLIVDGKTMEFQGDSWLAHDLRGSPDHIEATCRHGS